MSLFDRNRSTRSDVWHGAVFVFLIHPLYEHLDSNIGREHKFFASLQLKFQIFVQRTDIYGMFAEGFIVGEIRNWEVK